MHWVWATREGKHRVMRVQDVVVERSSQRVASGVWRLNFVGAFRPLLLVLTGCGGGLAGVPGTCAPGQAMLDGTCVSQQIADYVGCVRATGATVASDSAKSLSAAAGVAGLTASTKGEVKDSLEKKYAPLSDQNALEVVRTCDTKTAPRSDGEAHQAQSPSGNADLPTTSETPTSPAGSWHVPGGSAGATVVQEGSHLSVYVQGAPSVAYGTVAGGKLDVQFKWVPGCCTGTMSPDGKSIFWSNNSVWQR
jgi:hypothetical protein